MRAAVFKEMSRPLAIEQVPDPVCGPHDLILKVRNCGICGSDLHMTEPTSAMSRSAALKPKWIAWPVPAMVPKLVTVPLPDERGAVTGALMNAVLLRKGRSSQLSLDFGLAADTKAMETIWRDAEDGERGWSVPREK